MKSPMPSSIGVLAIAVSKVLSPMPRKKIVIMPSRLHLSASQPAGIAQTPKAT